MINLKQAFISTAIIAGSATASSANTLSQAQQEALHFARYFNSCGVEFNNRASQASTEFTEITLGEYEDNLEAYAEANGFADYKRDLNQQITDTISEASNNGIFEIAEQQEIIRLFRRLNGVENQLRRAAQDHEACEEYFLQLIERKGLSLDEVNKNLRDAYEILEKDEFLLYTAPQTF